jgi:acyl-CoA thioesterase-1
MRIRLTSQAVALAVGTSLLGVPAVGQQSDPPSKESQQSTDVLSLECRVPPSVLYSLAPLQQVRSAVEQRHRLKVLVLGPTSASAFGQGTALAPFPVRLEHELEKVLPGADVIVEARSLPGEITAQALGSIMSVVSEVEPELIVWQVGISDALAQADVAAFSEALNEVLAYFRAHRIEAILVEPPYTSALARDHHFAELVAAISDRALENGVALIRRSAAMRYLAEQTEAGRSRFELQNLGYHCTAEHVGYVVRLAMEGFSRMK